MFSDDLFYKGFWWLPDSPAKQVPGELEIKGGELHLSVIDNNSYSDAFADFLTCMCPVMNGYARDSKTKKNIAFTLFDLRMTQAHSGGGLAEYTFIAKYAVTSKHFKTKADIRIKSVFNRFQFLDDWIHASGLSVKRNYSTKRFNHDIKYEQPKELPLFQSNKQRLYVYYRTSTKTTVKHATITESIFINVEYYQKKSLDSFVEQFDRMRDFFSFAFALPIRAEKIGFFMFSNKEAKSSNSQSEYQLQ